VSEFNSLRCENNEKAIIDIKKTLDKLTQIISDQRALQEQVSTLFNMLRELRSEFNKAVTELQEVRVQAKGESAGQKYLRDLLFLIIGGLVSAAFIYLRMGK
jgi:archaellum component FlaC